MNRKRTISVRPEPSEDNNAGYLAGYYRALRDIEDIMGDVNVEGEGITMESLRETIEGLKEG